MLFACPACIFQFLITADKLIRSSLYSPLITYATNHHITLTSNHWLCLFLCIERRLGALRSRWYPYINCLPRQYSTLLWWRDEQIHAAFGGGGGDETLKYLLNARIKESGVVRLELSALNRVLLVYLEAAPYRVPARSDYDADPVGVGRAHPLLAALYNPATDSDDASWLGGTPKPAGNATSDGSEGPISYAEYLWAYSTVATRSCYYSKSQLQTATAAAAASSETAAAAVASSDSSSSGGGDSALVPVLDLLNHSSHVVCMTTIERSDNNSKSGAVGGGGVEYRLRLPSTSAGAGSGGVVVPAHPHESVVAGREVFISYGTHCNRLLLSRYGFVLGDNAHERVSFTIRELNTFLAAPDTWKSSAAISTASTTSATASAVKHSPAGRNETKTADRKSPRPVVVKKPAPKQRTAGGASAASGDSSKCSGECVMRAASQAMGSDQILVARSCGFFECLKDEHVFELVCIWRCVALALTPL